MPDSNLRIDLPPGRSILTEYTHTAYYVRGEEGIVHLVMYEPEEEHYIGGDLGYHAARQQYEGQEPMDCNFMPDGSCYYDGSTRAAVAALRLWKAGNKDPEIIWDILKEYYKGVFYNDD